MRAAKTHLCFSCRILLSSSKRNSAKKRMFSTKASEAYRKFTQELKGAFQKVEQRLKIEKPEDWYKWRATNVIEVSKELGVTKEINTLLDKFGGSLSSTLKFIYQDFPWNDFRFKSVPRGSMRSRSNHQLLFKHIEEALGITQLDDWYNITSKDVLRVCSEWGFKKSYISIMTNFYQSSLFAALVALYPNHPWDELKFKKMPRNVLLEETDNKQRRKRLIGLFTHSFSARRRKIFDRIGRELGVEKWQDWYQFVLAQLVAASDRIGLRKPFSSLMSDAFKGSMIEALRAIYPEHTWDPLKFKVAPRGTLDNLANQLKIVRALERVLGITEPEQWYSFSGVNALEAAKKAGVYKLYMSMLRNQWQSSLIAGLQKLYPYTNWDITKFRQRPKNYFASTDNQREIIKEFEKALGISKPEDWYHISQKQAMEVANAAGILSKVDAVIRPYFNSSLRRAVMQLFPEYKLNDVLFTRALRTTSVSLPVLRESMKYIGSLLHIEKLEDWYRVSAKQVRLVSNINYIRRAGGLNIVLPSVYPDVQWDMSKLSNLDRGKRSQQRLLFVFVKTLLSLSSDEITENYLSRMTYKETGERIELDIWIPKYNLALEYNGEHHYNAIAPFGTYREYQLRDAEKAKICKENGITLIVVPYTWNSTIGPVAESIRKALPHVPLQTQTHLQLSE